MRLLTFADVKPTVAKVLGVCVTDPRVVAAVNEAQERLITRGKWPGTYMRYRICTSDGCITWPRQIETIESMAICQTPGVVRNDWFEFEANSYGLSKSDSSIGNQMVDRGFACAFADITGITSKVRVYCDVTESGSAVINLRGYNEDGNWIRTYVSGAWIDGENVTLPAPGTPVLTSNKFSSLVAVIKPVTNGPVRLYQYDTGTAANVRAMAYYEPGETNPNYRRSLIPNLSNMSSCDNGTTTPCANKTITVMAKLQHLPLVNDSDFLLVSHLSGIKLMCMAIAKEERNLIGESQAYQKLAVQELEFQLQSHQGDGPTVQPRFDLNALYGGGGVHNVI